jgi:DNA polymerase-3 subunit gamma/tau
MFATTEPNKVLATIQSRCQRFDFQSINVETIGAQLERILKDEKIDYEKNLIIHLARLANGSMRDALSLLDQLISSGQQPLTETQLNELVGVPDRQKVVNLLTAIAEHDANAVLIAIEELISSGQASGQICDLLIQNMRDMMIMQSAGVDNKVLLLTEEEKKELSRFSQNFDVAALIYNITALEKLRWTLRNSDTSRALLEASLLRLALSEHFLGLGQLSASLKAANTVAPLKKKLAASDQPLPATANTDLSRFSDIASIQSSWQMITAQCGQKDSSLTSFLSQGCPLEFKDSKLTIQFASDGQGQLAKNMCLRKLDAVRTYLSQIFSEDIEVSFESSDTAALSQKKQVSEKSAMGTGMSRQQRQEALNDPVVQMVLKGFNATPVEIQKVEIQSSEDHDDMLTDQEID